MIEPFAFTFELKPKAIYLMSDIRKQYSKLSEHEINDKIVDLWSSNTEIVILDDRDKVIVNHKESESITNELNDLNEFMKQIKEMEIKLFG